jgi:hypothetical protein
VDIPLGMGWYIHCYKWRSLELETLVLNEGLGYRLFLEDNSVDQHAGGILVILGGWKWGGLLGA